MIKTKKRTPPLRPPSPTTEPPQEGKDNCEIPPLEVVFSFNTAGAFGPMHPSSKKYLKSLIHSLNDELLRRIFSLNSSSQTRLAIFSHGLHDKVRNSSKFEHLDFTDDVDALCHFAENASSMKWGMMSHCYELVLRKVRSLSWTPGSRRALVLVGCTRPHYGKHPGSDELIHWAVEARCLALMGIRVYAVEVKLQDTDHDFYQSVADITEGCHVTLEQCTRIDDVITAIVSHLVSPDKLEEFEQEVMDRDVRHYTTDIMNLFTTLRHHNDVMTSLQDTSSPPGTPLASDFGDDIDDFDDDIGDGGNDDFDDALADKTDDFDDDIGDGGNDDFDDALADKADDFRRDYHQKWLRRIHPDLGNGIGDFVDADVENNVNTFSVSKNAQNNEVHGLPCLTRRSSQRLKNKQNQDQKLKKKLDSRGISNSRQNSNSKLSSSAMNSANNTKSDSLHKRNSGKMSLKRQISEDRMMTMTKQSSATTGNTSFKNKNSMDIYISPLRKQRTVVTRSTPVKKRRSTVSGSMLQKKKSSAANRRSSLKKEKSNICFYLDDDESEQFLPPPPPSHPQTFFISPMKKSKSMPATLNKNGLTTNQAASNYVSQDFQLKMIENSQTRPKLRKGVTMGKLGGAKLTVDGDFVSALNGEEGSTKVYKIDTQTPQKRENISPRTFTLRHLSWSPWQQVISPVLPDENSQLWEPRQQQNGYRRKNVLEHIHNSTLFEVALKTEKSIRKRVVFYNFVSEVSDVSNSWEDLLFSREDVEQEVSKVVEKKCCVLLRHATFAQNGCRAQKLIQASLHKYDYAWNDFQGFPRSIRTLDFI